MILRQAGAEVIAVNSAAAAAKALVSSRPTLLVSDIGMHGEDGLAVVRSLRAAEAANGADPLPAIALTAFARPEDRDLTLAAGFDRHVAKPVEPAHLLAVLREVLAGRQAKQGVRSTD